MTSRAPAVGVKIWSGQRDSNPRRSAWEADTLPLSYARSGKVQASTDEFVGQETEEGPDGAWRWPLCPCGCRLRRRTVAGCVLRSRCQLEAYAVFDRLQSRCTTSGGTGSRPAPGGALLKTGTRFLVLIALAIAVFLGGRPAGSGEPHKRLEVDLAPHGVIQWNRGESPNLLVRVRRGDGWLSLASRYSGSTAAARAIRGANPALKNPLRDRPVKIPLETLRGDLRLLAVRTLFPIDARVELGYRHWVLDPFGDGGESWQWLAAVFCGRAERADDLRRANPELLEHGPRRGRPLLVPGATLLKVFRSLDPVPERLPPAPTPKTQRDPSAEPHCRTRSDEKARHAHHVRRPWVRRRRTGGVCPLPPAPRRSALLGGRRTFHGSAPRRPGQRDRPRDRPPVGHFRRHRHPSRLPDQDTARSGSSRVPSRR